MPAPFSPVVMDHFEHPRGTGSLPSPSGEGWAGSIESGRYMRMQVATAGDRLEDVRFGTAGCAPCIAAGSFMAEWARGRTAAEVLEADADWLRAELGGLPEARAYCADLAVEALSTAVRAALQEEARI